MPVEKAQVPRDASPEPSTRGSKFPRLAVHSTRCRAFQPCDACPAQRCCEKHQASPPQLHQDQVTQQNLPRQDVHAEGSFVCPPASPCRELAPGRHRENEPKGKPGPFWRGRGHSYLCAVCPDGTLVPRKPSSVYPGSIRARLLHHLGSHSLTSGPPLLPRPCLPDSLPLHPQHPDWSRPTSPP